MKNCYFINSNMLVYFIGTYIGIHNIVTNKTNYIGIDHHVQETVSAFYASPVGETGHSVVGYAETSVVTS